MQPVNRCRDNLAKKKTIGDLHRSCKDESSAHGAPRNANGCIDEGPTERDRVSGEVASLTIRVSLSNSKELILAQALRPRLVHSFGIRTRELRGLALSGCHQAERRMILEPLWFRLDISRKHILTGVFSFILALVTAHIESKRRLILLLLLFCHLQFDQRNELGVLAALAPHAKVTIRFHSEIQM